ncbi:unnamed protein product, partial [Symbiodinium pilosum]
ASWRPSLRPAAEVCRKPGLAGADRDHTTEDEVEEDGLIVSESTQARVWSRRDRSDGSNSDSIHSSAGAGRGKARRAFYKVRQLAEA